MNVTVIAKFIAKKEYIFDTEEALKKLVPPTQCEEGCISYDLYHDNENKQYFYLYEHWESEYYLNKHLKSKHLLDFLARSRILLVEPLSLSRLTLL